MFPSRSSSPMITASPTSAPASWRRSLQRTPSALWSAVIAMTTIAIVLDSRFVARTVSRRGA